MTPFTLDEKKTILALRSVIFLLFCFFLLYNPRMESSFSWTALSPAAVYLLSILALIPVEESRFRGLILPTALFLLDTVWISWAIYASEGFNSDLYLIYFLVMFMSGIQRRTWQCFLTGAVASLLYLGLWTHMRPQQDFLNAHTLLRLPFFFIVSFCTATFAQQAHERESRLKSRYQRELAKAERRAMTGLLAGKIAFHMNNPLSIVIGFAQSCLKRVGPSDPMRPAVKHMLAGASRCKDMVDSLLLLSDQGWTSLDATDLNVVFRDTLAAIEREGLLPNGRVELREELDGGLPVIRGERRQLSRAIRELAKNALEAMPGGGILTLRTRRARSAEGDEIRCEVEDTGPGIDAAVAAQIFEPFFTTRSEEGRGLGLCYVTAIAHRHRGAVLFETQAGRGTRFVIRLPANGRAVEQPRSADPGAGSAELIP